MFRGAPHAARRSFTPTPEPEPPTARALLELGATVQGDWGDSIRRIVQLDAEMLRVERVTFWSFGDETSSIHCDAGYVVSSRSFERGATLLESDHRAYFEALRGARMLSVEDVDVDARTHGLRDYSAIRRIVSMLNIPIWVDGRLSGVLCHEHVGTRRRWSPAEEEFAIGAGQVVASSLAARAQTLAESAARRAAFLDTVSRLILPSLDKREIASRVVGLVVPRFADFAIVWALSREGALELVASTHGEPSVRDLVEEAARAVVAESRPPGLTYVVGESQSVLLPDVSTATLEQLGPVQSKYMVKLGVRTIMAVPLTVAGKTFGALALFASDRHYRSEDLALAEAVAERAAAALENARLYDMAQQAIHARDEFLILAAHELRTPLTALQLFAHGARFAGGRGSAAEEAARGEALARQVQRLSALVERMCDATRIRADGIALGLSTCDLAEIVKERAVAAMDRARRRRSVVAVRAQSPVLGGWDRVRVAQLLDELLDNAIKFGDDKPIEIALDRDGKQALLTVRDQGLGIPADRVSSVFSPFERAVPKEQFAGLGLGLYIAAAIAEAHGGSIDVASCAGQGTTMVVRLPIELPSPATKGITRPGDSSTWSTVR